MDDLDSLKASLNSFRKALEEKNAEKQRYLNIAAEIGNVYDRMADDKAIIKEYKGRVKDFSKEKFDKFKGNLYKEVYKAKMEELLDGYDIVIKNIDANMDRLNTLRAEYENKAYKCNGLIGYLQSSINSVVHTIENWVN